MAAYSTVLVKPNPLLLRNRRTISDGNSCSIRSCAVLCASSKLFATLKFESFAMNSAASSRKWLRIPVVLLMQFMTTHGRRSSALAFSGGAMGGYSFSSSNSSSNWGSSTSYTTSRKEVDLCQDKDSDTAAAVVALIALCVVIYCFWVNYFI
ncbi:hypothetical protein WN944_024768 [Citrus x changshan-huyou]|uniref:Uncharacterized protein n=1 Tax=Citrus x changshan-huyou TaxID=2935761 RepID=A0AAP0LT44_9ROSI